MFGATGLIQNKPIIHMQLAIWINRQGVQHCAHLRLGNMYIEYEYTHIYIYISQAAGQTGFTHTEKI